MGADGTETTGEMQLEKEGCERKPALLEIRRGGRWCAGGAGMGMGGDGSGKRNPIGPCDLYRSVSGTCDVEKLPVPPMESLHYVCRLRPL
jgi:hypothetical protein